MDCAHASRFGRGDLTPSSLQAYARRSLDFLNLIETTVSSLVAHANALLGYTVELRDMTQRIFEVPREVDIDPEGRVSELMTKTCDAASRIHAFASRKRAAALADPDLHDDDGVVDAFDRFLAELSAYHDAAAAIVDAVATVEALRSPVIGTFTDVKDLFAALDR